MKCPHCAGTVLRPASEGGLLVKARYVRLTTDGRLVIKCGCGSELERLEATGRLVLFQRPVSVKSSASTPSGD